ncbi:hypothetical protein [Actinoplanes sp. CA-252034]|uniref:hypothetical protein n=1 Tax=Actinoplanes sp. CA-252034 TaxID=3239906 RepID=UPI003D96ABDA
MSRFGPALFVSRADVAAITEAEQNEILTHVRSAATRLGLTRLTPRLHDRDPETVGVLLLSEHGYHHMPDEIREEQDQAWAAQALRVGAEVDRHVPGVYRFTAYTVED